MPKFNAEMQYQISNIVTKYQAHPLKNQSSFQNQQSEPQSDL